MRSNAAEGAVRYVVSRTRCTRLAGTKSSHCTYRVEWAINPHMQVGAACPEKAFAQHAAFVETLRAAGAVVEELPFVHGAFDSVFAKDSALVVQRPSGTVEALLAHPRHAERRAEQLARALALFDLGVHVTAPPRSTLEGGDIVVLPRARGAFLGHGFRSCETVRHELEAFLQREVTCLELCDPRLYHLDMVLSVLDDGTALVCEEALSPAAMRTLAGHPAITSLVRVPLEEALRFGVNLVQVGRTVVLAGDSPTVEAALNARGLRVARVVLDEFHLAGGSAACLSARVHRQATATAATTHDRAVVTAA